MTVSRFESEQIELAEDCGGSTELRIEDLEALYAHYKPSLVRFAERQSVSDAEGVADLAFIDAFKAYPRMEKRTETAFRSYLFRAARSHAIADHRRNRPLPVEAFERENIDSLEDALADAELVRGMVAGLPADQRAVIESRFFEDLSVADTAHKLGKTPNAVHQLQHRAIRRLRALILSVGVYAAVALLVWLLGQDGQPQRVVDQSPLGAVPVVLSSTTTPPLGRSTRGDLVIAVEEDGPMSPAPVTSHPPVRRTTLNTSSLSAGDATPAPGSSTTVGDPPSTPSSVSTTTVPASSGAPALPATFAQTCDGEPATIVGSGIIYGTDGPDVIVGSNKDDTIQGLGGDDIICGGNGEDELVGGGGNDRLLGGNGRDRLLGGQGDDRLFGDNGRDELSGETGDDVLTGGRAPDELDGGSGNNTLIEDS